MKFETKYYPNGEVLSVTPINDWVVPFSKIIGVTRQAKDNLFSANHRNGMLQKYSYTEAMRIKIEDLI